MTRKYMNEKWCVRCGRTGPTPYLAKNLDLMLGLLLPHYGEPINVVDIGCGNGRNSEFVKSRADVVPLDMVDDYGTPCVLGRKPLPLFQNTVDVILANYVFMFLTAAERGSVIADLVRASRQHCVLMVELYPAKDSEAKDEAEMMRLQQELFDVFGWDKIRYSKGRFIAQRGE